MHAGNHWGDLNYGLMVKRGRGFRGAGLASEQSMDDVSGYSEPRITEGDDESTCHHELESSVNLAPDKHMPGMQAGSRLAGTSHQP